MRYIHIAQLRAEQKAEAAKFWPLNNPYSLKKHFRTKTKGKKKNYLISGNNKLHKPI
jgi:hypothetical protein